MSAKHHAPSLMDRLPDVRGRLSVDEPMARYTWLKVGGNAEVLFRPTDADDLREFLKGVPADVAVCVIGNASNLLVRDGGIRGVVIRLGSAFNQIRVEGQEIVAGAGAADLNVARAARDAGLTGLEFLSGIPGTIGGAVIMNGGAYGSDISDICVSASFVDRHGHRHELAAEDLGFGYRHTDTDPSWIVTDVRFRGEAGDKVKITERMEQIQNEREITQPVRTPTGGSTFANPPGHKAWELIDQAGCRGLKRGQAMVSDLHCNFLINQGGASASDLEGLGEEVRRRVFEHSGIRLDWEIRRIGIPVGSGIKEIDHD